MKAKVKELQFISLIKRDGSGVITKDITPSDEEEMYNLYTLSITNATFIAIAFNTYVVKLKN
jgi:hypothetical protein